MKIVNACEEANQVERAVNVRRALRATRLRIVFARVGGKEVRVCVLVGNVRAGCCGSG